MKFGYIRETGQERTLPAQAAALQEYGVDEIYEEWSQNHKHRGSQLAELLAQLRVGDELVVWRLDRLGMTIKQVVAMAQDFQARGVQLISLLDSEKLQTPLIPFLITLGAMEHEVIWERSAIGKHVSQDAGKPVGRKRIADARVKKALSMYYASQYTIDEIISDTGLSKSSINKYLRE